MMNVSDTLPSISCFYFNFFFCMLVFASCGCAVDCIETHLFCFSSLISTPLMWSPPQQPVKVKRKKSFNLSRKFPFYKSKENIVQELVESEREYKCVCGGLRALMLPVLHASSSFMLTSGTACVWLLVPRYTFKPSPVDSRTNQNTVFSGLCAWSEVSVVCCSLV